MAEAEETVRQLSVLVDAEPQAIGELRSAAETTEQALWVVGITITAKIEADSAEITSAMTFIALDHLSKEAKHRLF